MYDNTILTPPLKNIWKNNITEMINANFPTNKALVVKRTTIPNTTGTAVIILVAISNIKGVIIFFILPRPSFKARDTPLREFKVTRNFNTRLEIKPDVADHNNSKGVKPGSCSALFSSSPGKELFLRFH